jgi:hypothetical protein
LLSDIGSIILPFPCFSKLIDDGNIHSIARLSVLDYFIEDDLSAISINDNPQFKNYHHDFKVYFSSIENGKYSSECFCRTKRQLVKSIYVM